MRANAQSGGVRWTPCLCQRGQRGATVCELCGDLGMLVTREADGRRVAEPCECQRQRRAEWLLSQARIPNRYAHCTFENYDYRVAQDEPEQLLYRAYGFSRLFADKYPADNNGTGLLFTGTIGTGKTHLATAVLRQLIVERGARGIFYEYRELLKQITNSFNPQVKITEQQVLQPVYDAEVLVLDELGAARTTDWVADTIEHILNARYSSKKVTLITTNYPNQSEVLSRIRNPGQVSDRGSAAEESMREETLGDRIGARMWSRLQQMCIPLRMYGDDYRQRKNMQPRLH